MRHRPERFCLKCDGLVRSQVVGRLQCTHFNRAGRLGFDLRHGSGCSDCGCRDLLDMGCRLQRRCLVQLLRALGAGGFSLLALLVATAASAAPTAASLALFAGFVCGRWRLRNRRATGGVRRGTLALGRPLTLLLATFLGPLFVTVTATVALPLGLLSLGALLALAAGLLETCRLAVAPPTFPLPAFVAATARAVVGAGSRRPGSGLRY